MKPFILLLIVICLFLSTAAAFSETVYVSDSFEITMRTGPGGEFKIIAMLKSDTPLTLLKEDVSWGNVRTLAGTEGWVLKRYITDKIPNSILVETYKKSNEKLRNQITEFKKTNSELNETKNSILSDRDKGNKEYEKILDEYNALKKDAANVIQIRDSYTKTKQILENELKKSVELLKENDKLRFSANMKWFLSGAGVLIFGWIIGIIMGRYKRKQQSRLY